MITGGGKTPTIQFSLRMPTRHFFVALNRLYNLNQKDVRYWRADISTGTDQGFEYPAGRLLTSGAELLDIPEADLEKALGDHLVNPSDEFVVEIKENDQWIVDLDEFRRQQREQHETPLPSMRPNGIMALGEASQTLAIENDEPLFNSGGFFGEMSSRLGITSSTRPSPSDMASQTLQPPVNIAGRSKVTLGSRTSGTLGLANLCVFPHPQLTSTFSHRLQRKHMFHEFSYTMPCSQRRIDRVLSQCVFFSFLY